MCPCAAWVIGCGLRRGVFEIVCHSSGSLLIFCYSSVDGDLRQLTPSFLLYMTFHRMLHTGSSLPALAGFPSSRCLLWRSLTAYFATSCRPQYFASHLALPSALYPSRSPSFRYAC